MVSPPSKVNSIGKIIEMKIKFNFFIVSARVGCGFAVLWLLLVFR
jgi:hypothetical protein